MTRGIFKEEQSKEVFMWGTGLCDGPGKRHAGVQPAV